MDRTELSLDILEAQHGEQLPAREQMALINANLMTAVNAAVALNAITSDSAAVAAAFQSIRVNQR